MDQYSREFIAEKARLRPEDLGLVRTARRSHNQLGLAYQIAFIRLTGRAPGRQPFEILKDLVGYVATDLNANPRDLDLYARRQPTLSAHLERVREHLGLTAFDEKARQRLAPFVFKEAFRLEQGAALVSRCEEYLREKDILCPARSTLRRIVHEQRERARTEIFSRVLAAIPPSILTRLDALLEVAGESPTSALHDLKASPGLSSPRSFLTLVDKLEHIRATEALGVDLGWLNNNLRRSLARRARRTDAHRLRELAPPHRYAVLLCFLRDTYVESVDQAVEMHGKIITQTFRRARNELDERIVARRRLIREALNSFQRIARVVLDDDVSADQLRESIFRSICRDQLAVQVAETEQWLSSEPTEAFSLVVKRFQYLRRFSPSFFEHIPLRAAAGHSGDLLAAVEVLRAMNRDGGRKLPRDAPTRFLTPALRAIVESENGLDRRAYECAVVVAVRDELRRGNLWVERLVLVDRVVADAGLAQSIPLQVEALGTVRLRYPRVADQHWRLQNDRFCDA